ncbi:MAG: Xaa-Pro peptidase family protein [Mariprofundaceae bacterium]|nr:Xaa-Pro peptidase family protein [Mariprofundaceae bacterium]
MPNHHEGKLLIAASESDADMLYIAGMFVPDAFIVVGLNEIAGWQWHGLFSPLEIDRARHESTLDHIHDSSIWLKKAKLQNLGPGLAAIATAFLQEHGIRSINVPGNFPLQFADALRSQQITVQACDGSLFPQRAIKQAQEIKQLAKAEATTRRAMIKAETFLAACAIGNDGILRHPKHGKKVRSRDVRKVIETWLIGHAAMPAHTIVACGAEGADPHCMGHGYIYANTLIIIDIFPRLLGSGYWGDMTRTYVKGKASSAAKKMYNTVRDGQKIGLDLLCAGRPVKHIHNAIQDYFEQQGYNTGMQDGRQCGFFHGTGHGVGLDIHESPRVSLCDTILQAGHVVTVEPGLYYPDIGGVRLEDLAVVTASGHRNLTEHVCSLEIE